MTDTFVTSSTGKTSILKTDEGELDYIFNWTDWLLASGADTIASAVVTADDGLTVVATNVIDSGNRVEAWVTGGVGGTTYKLKCVITTSAAPIPRVEERSVYLKCKYDR